ncbi:hypothetical protein Hdeb2414_s0016g00489591 [Helianthus debilis subsp. tardiflorus]
MAALEYVRSRRPRVLLAPSQWKRRSSSRDAWPPLRGNYNICNTGNFASYLKMLS